MYHTDDGNQAHQSNSIEWRHALLLHDHFSCPQIWRIFYRRATSYGAACLAYPFFLQYNTIFISRNTSVLGDTTGEKLLVSPRTWRTHWTCLPSCAQENTQQKRITLTTGLKLWNTLWRVKLFSLLRSIQCAAEFLAFPCSWEAELTVFCPRSDAPKKTASSLNKPQVSLKTDLKTALAMMCACVGSHKCVLPTAPGSRASCTFNQPLWYNVEAWRRNAGGRATPSMPVTRALWALFRRVETEWEREAFQLQYLHSQQLSFFKLFQL